MVWRATDLARDSEIGRLAKRVVAEGPKPPKVSMAAGRKWRLWALQTSREAASLRFSASSVAPLA